MESPKNITDGINPSVLCLNEQVFLWVGFEFRDFILPDYLTTQGRRTHPALLFNPY